LAHLILLLRFIELTITIPMKEYQELRSLVVKQGKIIEELRAEIGLLKAGRKSNTSSTPSSQDYTGSTIHNSRKKSDRKSGGQKGHKGNSLKMSRTPDQVIDYTPSHCNRCGAMLIGTQAELVKKQQEIVIPPIVTKYIEHRAYQCNCKNCGSVTVGEIPERLKANIQYGESVQSLVTYMSVYQLLPAKRLKQFLKDFANLNISEGTIFNILSSMGKKASPAYEVIRQKVLQSKCVGGDETGFRINKEKAWFWIFQNRKQTFIRASYNRGYRTIMDVFPLGFPRSFYVSDSLPAQLKINSLGKQLCLAHLLRELKKFEEVFKSEWATQTKTLFTEAIDYKRTMQTLDYFSDNLPVAEFENRLTQLLEVDFTDKHKKERAFIKRLKKKRNAIFTFLYHQEVPPDNNASERGIRNIKVKMKISNQFKSYEFAQHFAVIRSIIDTTIKNGQDVFNALTNLAAQNLTPAE
jgi:transposase